ncbi:Tetratricopeptide domain protein [Chloroherpeton thalassium ATCC 35110]|uniref:Tetratricopeptide domain protein n=1 Tax=Chloroherpeton thalassium (strain ATCC 35110 / GB-78) TaxID=517418 RepID=B3QUI8_CHLT3|nr:tetratricopeptide domain-containing protein [Chloroherpeton thalassium]ACF12894.1 Tetratricopeptide domain protein [Chloroherpeton thalassium ATCC 35110]
MKLAQLFAICFLFGAVSASSLQAKVPETAHEGERIAISISDKYFKPAQSVWARVQVDFQQVESDENSVHVFQMKKQADAFAATFSIPKGAARVHFIYATKDTALIDPTVLRILDKKGNFVRRARLIGPGVTPNAKSMIKEEFAAYPDSYEALLQSWEITEKYDSPSALKQQLPGTLEAYLGKKRNAEFYYAVIWAYAKMQNTDRISHCFGRYEEDFPHSHYFLKTYEASADIAAEGGWSLPQDVQELAVRYFTNNLSAENLFEYGYLLSHDEASAEDIENFIAEQTRRHGNVPMIYYNAASAYLARLNYDKAIENALKARELMQMEQPDAVYFQDRMAGQQYPLLWPYLTKMLAVSYMALENTDKALAALKNGYSANRNMKIDGELYALEARCWELLHKYQKAEDLYFKAYILGLKWTKESLRDVYEKTHQTNEGFEAYFSRRIANYQ